MKFKPHYFFILLIFINHSFFAAVYNLYFLGGQSNMTGFGYVKDIPEKFNVILKDVLIFEGSSTLDYDEPKGLGLWAKLQPGHGVGFYSDGENNFYSDRFGPELSFGIKISELNPNKKIAIIKYSRNGSSIDASSAGEFGCWEPDFNDSNGINQYDHFLATIRRALAIKDIDSDGEEDILIPSGIIWMQGESDGTNTYEVAKNYSQNLKKLMSLIRAALRIDNLPVVIGQISDSGLGEKEQHKVWKYGEIIKSEQQYYVEKDKNSYLVKSTENYQYSDKYHYDSNCYIDLGFRFAEAINFLEKEKQLQNHQ